MNRARDDPVLLPLSPQHERLSLENRDTSAATAGWMIWHLRTIAKLERESYETCGSLDRINVTGAVTNWLTLSQCPHDDNVPINPLNVQLSVWVSHGVCYLLMKLTLCTIKLRPTGAEEYKLRLGGSPWTTILNEYIVTQWSIKRSNLTPRLDTIWHNSLTGGDITRITRSSNARCKSSVSKWGAPEESPSIVEEVLST